MTGSLWNWNPPLASFSADGLSGRAEVADPGRGLCHLEQTDTLPHPQPLRGAIMGVNVRTRSSEQEDRDSALCLREAFVRGDDLVAKYEDDNPHSNRMTLYWNLVRGSDASGIIASVSLTVSIETDLLAAEPVAKVISQLPEAEVVLLRQPTDSNPEMMEIGSLTDAVLVREAAPLVIYRWHNRDVSFAEMTHPSDFRQFSLDPDGDEGVNGRWQLFGQFLEKGVIRRSRMQGVWIRRADDVQLAIDRYREFIDREIPLTA